VYTPKAEVTVKIKDLFNVNGLGLRIDYPGFVGFHSIPAGLIVQFIGPQLFFSRIDGANVYA
jgi:hypothetical protein